MGAKVDHLGTVAVVVVAVLAVFTVTVALLVPKYTMLLAVVVLKPVPAILTTSPGSALSGVKDVMVGECENKNPAENKGINKIYEFESRNRFKISLGKF